MNLSTYFYLTFLLDFCFALSRLGRIHSLHLPGLYEPVIDRKVLNERVVVGSRRWNCKFREKHFWNPNPELLLHSSYSQLSISPPGSYWKWTVHECARSWNPKVRTDLCTCMNCPLSGWLRIMNLILLNDVTKNDLVAKRCSFRKIIFDFTVHTLSIKRTESSRLWFHLEG